MLDLGSIGEDESVARNDMSRKVVNGDDFGNCNRGGNRFSQAAGVEIPQFRPGMEALEALSL